MARAQCRDANRNHSGRGAKERIIATNWPSKMISMKKYRKEV
jgi:hypothetical protein